MDDWKVGRKEELVPSIDSGQVNLGFLGTGEHTMPKQIVKPYELYSKFYDHSKSEYILFLDKLSNLYSLRISSILDLACGTGSLIRELMDSGKVERAVGLDISAEMLHVAQQKFREAENVKLVKGDFRSFSLGEKFDTVLCVYDSLNYVREQNEVRLVFECVQNHLRTPGFFVFDVINENHCLWADGYSSEREKLGIIKWSTAYDRSSKKHRNFLEFKEGTEIHEQIPLEYDTIADIAKDAELSIAGVFSSRRLDPVDETSRRLHFVLRSSEEY